MTFKAADGRKITAKVTAEQAAERTIFYMAVAVMPLLTILVFALAAGIH